MTEHLIRLFSRELDGLKSELRAYDDPAQIWLSPQGISNSAGNLALHLAGNLQHYIGAILGESGYVHVRKHEFNAEAIPLEKVLAEIDCAREVVENTLEKMDERELQEKYPKAPLGLDVTVELFLLHLLSHFAYHLGQINYHRRLVSKQNNGVSSLSVKDLLPSR